MCGSERQPRNGCVKMRQYVRERSDQGPQSRWAVSSGQKDGLARFPDLSCNLAFLADLSTLAL
jgi:hypothetical protein